MIKEFFRKKSTKIVAIVLFSVFFILSVLTVISILGYRKIFGDIGKYQKISSTHNLEILKDSNGITTIRNIDNNEGLNILQLSDIHIGCSIGTYSKDKMAFDSVYAIIESSKPDLIVLTGDMCYPFFLTLGINNKLQAQAIADFFEQIGIYWTFNFGNHEDMGLVYLNATEVGSLLKDSEHCLFEFGDEDIYGEGNYLIKVLNNDKTFNSGLIFMDSNDYLPGVSNYDRIHNDQIEWYKETINLLAKEYDKKTQDINTFLFIHIPLQAYSNAYNEYLNKGSVKYVYGKIREGVCTPYDEDSFFDDIVELSSTRAVFCGHDHLNTATFIYKNVALSYGMSIDYLAYIGIQNKNEQRGGQLIKIKENNTFSLTQIAETNNYQLGQEYIINIKN